MTFKVIDKKTGKEADTYEIALKEDWAKSLMYCDMEGFFIGEDGYLMLADECGNYAYPPQDRFEVVFDDDAKQEPCENECTEKPCLGKLCRYYKEPCEDAISRGDVYFEISEWIVLEEYQYTNATEYLRKRIDKLPSVYPSSRKGHWEKYGKLWKCSECEDLSCCHENYCNHCGADMRGKCYDNKTGYKNN